MAIPTATYQYPAQIPSGHIRILLRHPDQSLFTASGQRLAHFTLQTVPLSHSTKHLPNQDPASLPFSYTALSYVWGPKQQPRYPIAIDYALFSVGLYLFAALAHLLKHFTPPYWIDAICIKQDDAVEKGMQVAQMGDVYRYAKRVLVWLGPGDAKYGKAIAQIDKIGAAALREGVEELSAEHLRQWPDLGGDGMLNGIKNNLEKVMEGSLSEGKFPVGAFLDLMDNVWFERAWVVQELSVPNKNSVIFVAGFDYLPYEHLAAGYKLFLLWYAGHLLGIQAVSFWPYKFIEIYRFRKRVGYWPRRPNARAGTTLGFRKKYWKREERMAWKELLTSSYTLDSAVGLQCEDPRDRIYALAGMTSDTAFLGEASTFYNGETRSLGELYTNVARHLISQGHLDILSLCRAPERDGDSVDLTSSGPSLSFNSVRSLISTFVSGFPGILWAKRTLIWALSICRSRSVPTTPSEQDDSLPSWVPDWRKPMRPPWGLYKEDELSQASRQESTDMSTVFSLPNTLKLRGWHVGTIHKLGPVWEASLKSFDWVAAKNLLERVEQFLEQSTLYNKEERENARWRIPIGNKEQNALMQTVPATSVSQAASDEMKKELCSWRPGSRVYGAAFTSYMNMMWSMYQSRPFITTTGHVGLCPAAARAGDSIYCVDGSHVPYAFYESKPGGYVLVGEVYVEGIKDGKFRGEAGVKTLLEVV